MTNDADHYLRILNGAIDSPLQKEKGTGYSMLCNAVELVGEYAGSHTKDTDIKYLLDKSAELNRVLTGIDGLQQKHFNPAKQPWGQSTVSNELKKLARKIEIKQSQLHGEIADKLNKG